MIEYIRRNPRHSLIVFHRNNSKGNAEFYGENVQVHCIEAPCLRIPNYNAYPWLYLLSPKRRILKIAKEFQPDILLTVTPYIPGDIGRSALFVSQKPGKPLLGSFDLPLSWNVEYYIQKIFKIGCLVRLIRRVIYAQMRSYEKCVNIVVPSMSMDRYIKESYEGMKTIMFPRAVDSWKFSPGYSIGSFKAFYGIEDKIVILFVGRFALEKNLRALAGIYAELRSRLEGIALMMVGEGPEREWLKKRQLPDLIFTGALHGEKLSQAYADARPMVILEAMASGLPVVVHNTGGAHEGVINGETGFVVEDMEQYEKRLEQLIRDEKLRLCLGANARRYAEDQNWNRIWNQLMTGFEEISRRRSK